MTVSISNMAQVWMSNTNTYNAISMSVSTLGAGANANSRVLRFKVDGNTVYGIDAVGVQYTLDKTVASLPNPTLGARAFVTDANNNIFNSIVYTGGSNSVPVFSDGTYWRIG